MGLTYESPPNQGAVRQGEIIGPLWEHRVVYPPRQLLVPAPVQIVSRLYDLVVVLSPDCDLEQDYEARFLSFWNAPDDADVPALGDDPNDLTHVLLVGVQNRAELRPRFEGKPDLWQRLSANLDERYHHIEGAHIAESVPASYLHGIYLDFKKTIAMPTGTIYDGLLSGSVDRVGILPAYYVHDLIHRFYGFLSRVALP
jgi:hypothetical protein